MDLDTGSLYVEALIDGQVQITATKTNTSRGDETDIQHRLSPDQARDLATSPINAAIETESLQKGVQIRRYLRAYCQCSQHNRCSGIQEFNAEGPYPALVCTCSCHYQEFPEATS